MYKWGVQIPHGKGQIFGGNDDVQCNVDRECWQCGLFSINLSNLVYIETDCVCGISRVRRGMDAVVFTHI